MTRRDDRRYGGNFLGYMSRDSVPVGSMHDDSSDVAFLGRARDASSRGEWQKAYDLLVEADAQSPLIGPDLALLADMAYAAGHLDVTIASWERAYRQSVRAGERLS